MVFDLRRFGYPAILQYYGVYKSVWWKLIGKGKNIILFLFRKYPKPDNQTF